MYEDQSEEYVDIEPLKAKIRNIPVSSVLTETRVFFPPPAPVKA